MRLYLKLLAAAILAMTALTAHAGLFDDLGAALGGGAKTATADTAQTADNPTDSPNHNLAVTRTNNAGSDKRIALVIGNSSYINSPLKNPVNDAKDMAKKLRGLGFDVIERTNLKTKQIGGTLSEFRSKLSSGAVALVFYAGHGLQINGENYLPAVDADINAEEDVQNQSLSVRQIMDVLDKAKTRLNLVFLDACRNNPYASRSFRSTERGLARVSAPSGTLISYATRPGSVAADGDGRNGLYTGKLLAQMDSNIQIELTLKRVVTEVKTASQGKQEPWMEGSIEGDFCFGGCAASGGTQVASLVPVPTPTHSSRTRKTKEEIEQGSWESAKNSNAIEAIQEYLKQYPKGAYAGQARILIASLKAQAAKPAEPIPAPVTSSLVREDNETALWTEAQKGGAREDYQAYLSQYPKGKYTALAKGRLKKFDDEAAQQARLERAAAAQQAAQQEQSAWDSANSSASEAGYQDYLNSYPKGRFETLAKARLAKLKKEAATTAAQQATHAQTEAAQQAQREREAAAQQAALARAEAARPKPSGPVMVRIPGKNYEMGKYEVTQKEWKAVMGNNPSHFTSCGDSCPVENVSWNDIQEYLQKLNAKTGRQYRLPTEAEWEYACYSGSQTKYCGGNDLDAVGWYGNTGNPGGNSNSTTHPVGQKQANGYGLYDMSGNVWEWMQDNKYGNESNRRVFRGGSWAFDPLYALAAYRSKDEPAGRDNGYGFRLSRTLP